MDVEPGIPEKGGFQVLGAVIASGVQHHGDTAIETPHHAIGLRGSQFGMAAHSI